MRILTSKQFESEPIGTVYCQWIPEMYIGEVCIKGSKRGTESSWWNLSLLPNPISNNTYHTNEIDTEEFCTDEATYNYDEKQLWCVFNKEEIKGMIQRLQNALEGIVD